MPTPAPLDVEEELLWRSLMRLVVTLLRAMNDDLESSTELNISEYRVLMYLSEAPDRHLRMSDLADQAALSAGRITRVVDDLNKRGLVTKEPCPDDGRSMLATLTEQGLSTLKRAYPHLLLSVRTNVFDHATSEEIRYAGPMLKRFADAVDATHPPRPPRTAKR